MLRSAMTLASMDVGLRRGARVEHLGHAEDGADAVGEVFVFAGEDAVEVGLGGGPLAAGPEEEAELGGGEEVVRGGRGCGTAFGLGREVHAEEEVGELAAEFVFAGSSRRARRNSGTKG